MHPWHSGHAPCITPRHAMRYTSAHHLFYPADAPQQGTFRGLPFNPHLTMIFQTDSASQRPWQGGPQR
eukprot:3337973-Pyramimonas_sp.AAC.1